MKNGRVDDPPLQSVFYFCLHFRSRRKAGMLAARTAVMMTRSQSVPVFLVTKMAVGPLSDAYMPKRIQMTMYAGITAAMVKGMPILKKSAFATS